MQRFLSAKLIAIGALAACDTTDGNSIRTLSSAGDAVVTATEQTGNSDFGAAVDTATSLFTFTNNGSPLLSLASDRSVVNGELTGYRSATDGTFAFAGVTSNSIAAVGLNEAVFPIVDGQVVSRLGTTTVPATGTATYSGDYAGFYTLGTVVDAFVYGDAELNADFAANTISGTVTNRQLVDTTTLVQSPDFADLTLGSATVDANGGFSSTTSGGEISGATATGSYSGLLTGSNAQEAAGQIQVIHDLGTGTGAETGVFIAN